MNRILILLLAAPAAATLAVHAQAIESAARDGYSAFRIVSERNIFDANRSSRSSRLYTRDASRPARTDSFMLVGTMSYEKGYFAFFDGSSSEFRKVLQPDDSIAGFKVAEVAPACVKLQTTNGQTVELCVGMQMRKREEEPWQLTERVEPAEAPVSLSASGDQSARRDDDPDVLKRLMERREQEGAAAAEPAARAEPGTETRAPEPKNNGSNDEADDVLKRLLQKREQELNK